MNAEEFAIKYLGKEVRLKQDAAKGIEVEINAGIVIGYIDNFVIYRASNELLEVFSKCVGISLNHLLASGGNILDVTFLNKGSRYCNALVEGFIEPKLIKVTDEELKYLIEILEL